MPSEYNTLSAAVEGWKLKKAIPPAEFTPHIIQSDEHGQPEFVRVLARPGDKTATLSIVVGGRQSFYALDLKQTLIVSSSSADSALKLLGFDT